jgi:hypothetical protein
MISTNIKINAPSMCDALDFARQEIFKFTDKYKTKVAPPPVKSRSKEVDKKSKKHKHRREENPEETQEEWRESVDLNNLHLAFDNERPKDLQDHYRPITSIVKSPMTKPQVKGPHVGGVFITGDFCSETMAASNIKKVLMERPESLLKPSAREESKQRQDNTIKSEQAPGQNTYEY